MSSTGSSSPGTHLLIGSEHRFILENVRHGDDISTEHGQQCGKINLAVALFRQVALFFAEEGKLVVRRCACNCLIRAVTLSDVQWGSWSRIIVSYANCRDSTVYTDQSSIGSLSRKVAMSGGLLADKRMI
jgi:hypothetical protein